MLRQHYAFLSGTAGTCMAVSVSFGSILNAGLNAAGFVMLSGSQDLHVKKQVWHWYISQAPLTGDWLTVSPFFDSQRGHVFIATSSFLIDSLSPSVFVPTLSLSAGNQAAANNGLLFPARQASWRQESFCVSSLPDQTPGQAEGRTDQG